MTDTTQANEPSGAQKLFGDFAPGLVHFTDDVLFGEVWKRPQLSPKERSLITVAARPPAATPSSSPATCSSPRTTGRPNKS
jgi:hypothetical protein